MGDSEDDGPGAAATRARSHQPFQPQAAGGGGGKRFDEEDEDGGFEQSDDNDSEYAVSGNFDNSNSYSGMDKRANITTATSAVETTENASSSDGNYSLEKFDDGSDSDRQSGSKKADEVESSPALSPADLLAIERRKSQAEILSRWSNPPPRYAFVCELCNVCDVMVKGICNVSGSRIRPCHCTVCCACTLVRIPRLRNPAEIPLPPCLLLLPRIMHLHR